MRYQPVLALALSSTISVAPPVAAQGSFDSLVVRLSGMTAVSGFERAMTDTLLTLLPGSVRDRAGNVVLTFGSGSPTRLVACPVDEPGFVVGRVQPDGYLTLRRVGPTPARLADQQYEGQRVTVFGRLGAVPGVVGVRSVHLTRGRPAGGDLPFTFDDAVVDLGARSAGEVGSMGVAELAPLALEKRPLRYGDGMLAAPVSGRRLGCAALIEAVRQTGAVRVGTTVVAFVVEQSFTRRGLAALARLDGPFEQTVMLEAGKADSTVQPPSAAARLGALAVWWIPTRYPGSPAETVRLSDGRQLMERLQGFLGGEQ